MVNEKGLIWRNVSFYRREEFFGIFKILRGNIFSKYEKLGKKGLKIGWKGLGD